MTKATPVLLGLLLLSACRREPAPDAFAADMPPAPVLANLSSSIKLDQALQLLEDEISQALQNEGEMPRRMERAEAITDRLLETSMPFTWISSRAYGVEPMLRQIQALADRIMAQLRNGVRTELVRRDLTDLQAMVKELRAGLRQGGSMAPPTLDSLVAGYAADTVPPKIAPEGGE